MSLYRITIENIPGMGGTLEPAPMTIACDGLCVIGITKLADGMREARTAIHGVSSEDITHVIAANPPLHKAAINYLVNHLRENEDGK